MWIFFSKLVALFAYPMGFMTLCLVLGLFFRLIRRKKTALVLWFLSIVTLFSTSSPYLSSRLVQHLERQHAILPVEELPKSDLVVMLGGALALPVPPRPTAELVHSSDRVLHTARIYKAGKASKVFLAGGNVFDGYHSKGETYYVWALLQEWGVPEAAIHYEVNSRNTYQNALETKKYLQDSGQLDAQILLVTSAIHMPRSLSVFRAAGLNVIPAVTDINATGPNSPRIFSFVPNIGAMASFTAAWHEILGLWVYRIRGWA